MTVKETMPAEVIGEIVGPNALKMGDPAFEAAVIGVDVLNVKSMPDAHARAQVHGFVNKR